MYAAARERPIISPISVAVAHPSPLGRFSLASTAAVRNWSQMPFNLVLEVLLEVFEASCGMDCISNSFCLEG
jgi:hypothetical protein